MAKKSKKKWSQKVTNDSDVMDLENGVFTKRSAKEIARSVKQSAEHSDRRKTSLFQSAMSMLTFYINRAGGKLSRSRRETLEKSKDELRKDFGKDKQKLIKS
jgi:hypothetical protein